MIKDFTGMKFGKLLVIERLHGLKEKYKTHYRCLCECGNERIVYSSDLSSGKIIMCKECVKKKGGSKRIDRTGQKFGRLTILKMLYNYNNSHRTYVECQCDCGNKRIIFLPNIIKGATQSCGCYEKESRYGRPQGLDILGQKFGMLNVIEKTTKRAINGAVIWKCRCDCGNLSEATCTDLKSGHKYSCGCKHRSKTEIYISQLLIDLKEDFIEEKRFDDCMNFKKTDTLPFDFYIPNKKIAIEYDGQQHFEPIEYFGGIEKFKSVQENDKIKNKYCKKNGIVLLRLSYTLSKEEIKEKILNILNP